MPADGRRKKLVVAVRDALKSATGVEYFNNLSVAGTVELGRETTPSMLEGGSPVVMRVRDLEDRHEPIGGADTQGRVQIGVDVLVRDAATTLVERLQDVLADVTLAIGKNRGLGGQSTTLRLASVDPPTYDFDGQVAYVLVRVAATYDYVAGADR